MELVGIADLVARWTYTRQGVHKLLRRPDFPVPRHVINRGRTKIWALSDIEIFEQANREVLDANEKRRRSVGYYLSTMKEREVA